MILRLVLMQTRMGMMMLSLFQCVDQLEHCGTGDAQCALHGTFLWICFRQQLLMTNLSLQYGTLDFSL